MVVLGAFALLGVGALTFLGGDPPTPGGSPMPTGVAVVSPSPAAASPTPAVRPTPSPAETEPAEGPSPSPEPEVTPETTPPAIEVEEGEGHITFGTGRASNLRIANPRSSFEVGERPLYAAQLLQTTPVNGLTIEVRRYDSEAGGEELVNELAVSTNLPRVHTVRQRLDTSELDGPGIYVMRFVSNGSVMAEGWFELTD